MIKQVLVGVFLATLVVAINAGKEDDECIDELKLDGVSINKWSKLKPLPEDQPSFDGYLECLYTKKGIITNQGFDWDKFSVVFFEEVVLMHANYPQVRRDMLKRAVDQIINACKEKNLKGPTPGKTVILVKNCINEELKKVYTEYHRPKN